MIKFEQFEEGQSYTFKSPSVWRQWCCKCKTAHLWLIQIVDGRVQINLFLDDKATQLRKHYEKTNIKGK